MATATLPPNWAIDFDGTRWFYRYEPTGLVQYHFPTEGDEFPAFVDDAAPVPALAPEERLASRRQGGQQHHAGDRARKSGSGRLGDGGFGMSATSARPVSEIWDGNCGDEDDEDEKEEEEEDGDKARSVFQPENFMFLGPGAYADVSPLAEEEEEAAKRAVVGKVVSPQGSEKATPVQGKSEVVRGPSGRRSTPSAEGDAKASQPSSPPSTHTASAAAAAAAEQDAAHDEAAQDLHHELPVVEAAPGRRRHHDPVGMVAEMATGETAKARAETHPEPVELVGDGAGMAPVEWEAPAGMAELAGEGRREEGGGEGGMGSGSGGMKKEDSSLDKAESVQKLGAELQDGGDGADKASSSAEPEASSSVGEGTSEPAQQVDPAPGRTSLSPAQMPTSPPSAAPEDKPHTSQNAQTAQTVEAASGPYSGTQGSAPHDGGSSIPAVLRPAKRKEVGSGSGSGSKGNTVTRREHRDEADAPGAVARSASSPNKTPHLPRSADMHRATSLGSRLAEREQPQGPEGAHMPSPPDPSRRASSVSDVNALAATFTPSPLSHSPGSQGQVATPQIVLSPDLPGQAGSMGVSSGGLAPGSLLVPSPLSAQDGSESEGSSYFASVGQMVGSADALDATRRHSMPVQKSADLSLQGRDGSRQQNVEQDDNPRIMQRAHSTHEVLSAGSPPVTREHETEQPDARQRVSTPSGIAEATRSHLLQRIDEHDEGEDEPHFVVSSTSLGGTHESATVPEPVSKNASVHQAPQAIHDSEARVHCDGPHTDVPAQLEKEAVQVNGQLPRNMSDAEVADKQYHELASDITIHSVATGQNPEHSSQTSQSLPSVQQPTQVQAQPLGSMSATLHTSPEKAALAPASSEPKSLGQIPTPDMTPSAQISSPSSLQAVQVSPGSVSSMPTPPPNQGIALSRKPTAGAVPVTSENWDATQPGQAAPVYQRPAPQGQVPQAHMHQGHIAHGQTLTGQVLPGHGPPSHLSAGQTGSAQTTPGQTTPGQMTSEQFPLGHVPPSQVSPQQPVPGQMHPGQTQHYGQYIHPMQQHQVGTPGQPTFPAQMHPSQAHGQIAAAPQFQAQHQRQVSASSTSSAPQAFMHVPHHQYPGTQQPWPGHAHTQMQPPHQPLPGAHPGQPFRAQAPSGTPKGKDKDKKWTKWFKSSKTAPKGPAPAPQQVAAGHPRPMQVPPNWNAGQHFHPAQWQPVRRHGQGPPAPQGQGPVYYPGAGQAGPGGPWMQAPPQGYPGYQIQSPQVPQQGGHNQKTPGFGRPPSPTPHPSPSNSGQSSMMHSQPVARQPQQ